ncbi:MAG: hypothetical protein KDA51_04010, partial [Planctomycetales bacterium]|nr:hypothetical protein [Planctomycetales bacterium]
LSSIALPDGSRRTALIVCHPSIEAAGRKPSGCIRTPVAIMHALSSIALPDGLRRSALMVSHSEQLV